ncbi:hypothetical protein [Arcanobacterium ihumii]|uniref:hypothetical protein n=1 Tax=Arcanobacterium ihumii TaxID=2138162 RepID=UPI001F17C574|nr:hypothetical protein [Arcanobacterium ihumii]
MSSAWHYYQRPRGRDYNQLSYSRSWTTANDFARPDGVVVHIGFVTKYAGMATDDGMTYRSFAIAQHIRNHHAWIHGDQEASRRGVYLFEE